MEYHYRFLADGRCEVLCMRCFLKIGEGAGPGAARVQADLHICPLAPGPGVFVRPSTEAVSDVVRAPFLQAGIAEIPAPYLLLLATVFFYLIPTLLEFTLLRSPNLWVPAIAMGDLSGCLVIFAALRKKKLAVLLYVALTVVEGVLYSTQALPIEALVYLMDLVPTAIIAGSILRRRRLMLTTQ